MGDVKWIKIVVDIFDDEKIKLIETLPSADTIIVIWFKILCLAGKSNCKGFLVMNDRIAYTDEMLAAIFRRKVSDVRMALEVFERYGMVEIIENTYTIPNWEKHQSLDYYEKKKEYDREYRKRQREDQKKQLGEGEKKSRTIVVPQSYDSSTSNSNNISFKDNTNIQNLNYLLENDLYKNAKYLKEHSELLSAVRDWMDAKDARTPKSNNHYTEQGMKSILTEIIGKHKQYGDAAVCETINHTIANQWQGIVWDWMEKRFQKIESTAECNNSHDEYADYQ